MKSVRERFRSIIFGTLLVSLLITYALLCRTADYSLPVPWPDEAHFIWQANAIAEHGTLYSPELNQDRTIMWMPPGYMVTLGLVFKLSGLSLNTARLVSLGTMLAAFLFLALILKKYNFPILSLVLAIPFLLGPPSIASGNAARMEPLVLLTVLAGFYLLQRRRRIEGISLLALAPLVHPNGVYFLLAGVVTCFFLTDELSIKRNRLHEIIMIACVVIAWGLYAYLAISNWDPFVTDMGYQFSRKSRGVLKTLTRPGTASPILLTITGAVYAIRRRMKSLFILAIALPAWWIPLHGKELWYGVYFCLGLFLLLVFLLHVAIYAYRKPDGSKLRRTIALLGGTLSVMVISYNALRAPSTDPIILGDPKPWFEMKRSPIAYIQNDDIIAVGKRLSELTHGNHAIRLQFSPEADAFFFTQFMSDRLLTHCPLFTDSKPDWHLVHISRLLPIPIRNRAFSDVNISSVNQNSLAPYLILERDSTDVWFLIPSTADTSKTPQTKTAEPQ